MLSNSWGCSQIVLTTQPNPRLAFTSVMHLEPGNKPKNVENIHFQIEYVPNTTDTFYPFLDEFL